MGWDGVAGLGWLNWNGAPMAARELTDEVDVESAEHVLNLGHGHLRGATMTRPGQTSETVSS